MALGHKSSIMAPSVNVNIEDRPRVLVTAPVSPQFQPAKVGNVQPLPTAILRCYTRQRDPNPLRESRKPGRRGASCSHNGERRRRGRAGGQAITMSASSPTDSNSITEPARIVPVIENSAGLRTNLRAPSLP